jgi:autotransporter-associated beta strand protein
MPVKKIAGQILVWCCVLALTAVFVQSVRAAPPSGTTWGLLYADEFGGSSVDTQKWVTQYPWGPTHNAGNDAYILAQNLSVANGVLTETAKRETAPDGKAFTSGTISTGYNFLNYSYGYAEARIKLPSRIGSFPAFWGLYTGWPPEADIMEYPIFTSGMNYNKYNIAYHYTNTSGNAASYGPGLMDAGAGSLANTWHTYGMEWTSSYIKFYFDGTLKSTITDTTAIAQMSSMYLILNYAVGNWAGVPDTTQWPVGATDTTQVDWVRVWKNTSGYSSATSWTLAGNGSWDTSSNWSSGSPQICTQTATFGSVGASNVTIDWGNSRTVGGLVLNSSVNYTLGSGNGNNSIMLTSATPITSDQPNTNTVLIDASSATGSSPNVINSRLELYNNVTIRSPNKPLTINGPITGLGSLRIDSGQITLNNSATYSGSTTIAGGTLKLGASPITAAHRWSFNNNLVDSVGGSNATIVDVGANNVTLSSTQATLAGGTSTTSDYIHLGSNLLPNTNTPVAIELWATPKSIQNWSRIFDFGSSTSENLLMSWTQGTNQYSDRVEWKDAATNTSDNSNEPYNLNTEYHIVMVMRPMGSSTEVTWYAAPAGSANLGPAKGSFVTSNNLVNFINSEDNLGRSSYSGDNTANASYNEVRFWTGPINSTILEILHDAGPDANLNSLNIGMAGGELPSTTAVSITGSGATLDLNGISQTIGSLSGVTGSTVLLGSGTLTLGGIGTSTTFSGNISGTGGLIKNGGGTFTIAGTNTYGGTTSINNGVLKGGAVNVLPNGPGKGNVSIASGAKLDLGGFNQTINGLSGNGTVDNSIAGYPVLTVGANDANSTFNGVIQNTVGSIALVKTGTGTITIAGANTYSGTTSVSGGVLALHNASALGATTAGTSVENGAGLLIDQSLNIGNELLSLNGEGGGNGALHIGGISVVNYGGAISLVDNTSIKVDAGSTLNLTNALGISGLN